MSLIDIACLEEIETYEDCPIDEELLVWTGDSFAVEMVSLDADTGSYYPSNGVEFVAYAELPDRDATFIKFERLFDVDN